MMPVFQIRLAKFAFPTNLEDSKANFRFVFDIRYQGADGAFATEHAVLPSLDTYWECDTHKRENPNYVRGGNSDFQGPEGMLTLATFDMMKIDEWDRLILRINAQAIHSLQFKAFDVNRDDFWNGFKEAVGQVIQALLGKAKGLIAGLPGPVPAVAAGALGTAADDVVSHLLKRLSNVDELLTRGSVQINEAGQAYPVVTQGTGGRYRMEVDVQ